ncbi:hypothetical protein JXJ21_15830 [candidate division KSB1 bacterium]|nr:hypothetical protein [candidate division KSB1 bacterium]
MSDGPGFGDFDDFDHDADDENPNDWDENQWEAYFQEEDERHKRFEELLNKYGHTEEGIRNAFKEMGWDISEFEDDEAFDFEEEDDDENYEIDDILEKQYGSWEADFMDEDAEDERQAHPLFKKLHELLNEVLNSMKNIEIENEEDPVVVFQRGLMEAMSKLIHAGYYNFDAKFEAPRGLVLAALKRVRKSLFASLFIIPELKRGQTLSRYRLTIFHSSITDILRDVNYELIQTRKS